MKRLLAHGSPSIYQITKAFRRDETGTNHNPEFTILEWYSVGSSLSDIMDETDQLLQSAIGSAPAERTTFTALFQKHLGIAPFNLSGSDFQAICSNRGIIPPDQLIKEFNQGEAQDFLMGFIIQPGLGEKRPVLVKDFPRVQSGCARPNPDGVTAQRFEAYFKGIELCNGYQEILDRSTQLERFNEINQERIRSGKATIVPDPFFLAALELGLPECSGNALGVDRLIMLGLKKSSISEVIAFNCDNC